MDEKDDACMKIEGWGRIREIFAIFARNQKTFAYEINSRTFLNDGPQGREGPQPPYKKR